MCARACVVQYHTIPCVQQWVTFYRVPWLGFRNTRERKCTYVFVSLYYAIPCDCVDWLFWRTRHAAHGHWCTFTDLYHTMPYHAHVPLPYHTIPCACTSTMPPCATEHGRGHGTGYMPLWCQCLAPVHGHDRLVSHLCLSSRPSVETTPQPVHSTIHTLSVSSAAHASAFVRCM